jgi:hypothetical protein
MLYQALAGVWPTDLHSEEEEGLKPLEGRFIAYVEKAMREAKLRTNWGDSNEAYETAVLGYARRSRRTIGPSLRTSPTRCGPSSPPACQQPQPDDHQAHGARRAGYLYQGS